MGYKIKTKKDSQAPAEAQMSDITATLLETDSKAVVELFFKAQFASIGLKPELSNKILNALGWCMQYGLMKQHYLLQKGFENAIKATEAEEKAIQEEQAQIEKEIEAQDSGELEPARLTNGLDLDAENDAFADTVKAIEGLKLVETLDKKEVIN